MYKAIGNKIVNVINPGTQWEESWDTAQCSTPEQAEQAIKMMDRAHYLNDVKRQYTNSARLFFKVEQLPGFVWLNRDGADGGIPA